MSDSDTVTEQPKAANPIPNSKPFKKGDPRINRKGRPKSFDQLRALAQKISHEPIKEGATMTAAEAILRKLALENPTRFLEIAYGKVPDEVKLSGEVATTVKGYVSISPDDWDVQPAALAGGSVEGQKPGSTANG